MRIRFRVGNQTAFSAADLMAPFHFAVANRFDAFEWLPDKKCGGGWQESDITAGMRGYIRQTAAGKDISLSVHAPCNFSPFMPDALVVIRNAADFARQTGAGLLVVHLAKEQGLPAYAEAVLPIIRQLSAEGFRIAIENTIDTGPRDFNRLFDLLWSEAADNKAVGMCLDIGHANLNMETRNDYLGYVDALGPHVPVIHVHMHENHGDSDSHLAAFTGPSAADDSGVRGLVRRLVDRDFSGSMIMEQWPQPPELLATARDRILEIAGNSIQARS
ncbi:MAG: TIM barrel protein [Nitrospiraceae bacterium]|nr:TIM barrel protein [Nitrospiraceae bacterium]MDA8090712.1 TIM barrel protein [Nitrospiraceae bacterium]